VTPEAAEVLADLRDGQTWTIAALATNHGWPRRTVEACLQELRLAGEPIVTDAYGVHLARSADEVAECVAALRRRAVHQMLTARALRRTARRMREAELRVEPQSLWDFAG
jgi:hypothetical protein